mmetsp:Transcript_22316/g.64878  ORF Transcript_22316/g.64878 Transcript_22316/m.64878 type:complete len:204 (-) Transcript_22316:1193-1804(-)
MLVPRGPLAPCAKNVSKLLRRKWIACSMFSARSPVKRLWYAVPSVSMAWASTCTAPVREEVSSPCLPRSMAFSRFAFPWSPVARRVYTLAKFTMVKAQSSGWASRVRTLRASWYAAMASSWFSPLSPKMREEQAFPRFILALPHKPGSSFGVSTSKHALSLFTASSRFRALSPLIRSWNMMPKFISAMAQSLAKTCRVVTSWA